METTEPNNKSRKLGVSRSSLCYRAKKPDKDESLRRRIEEVMLKNPGYGSPRVALALNINEKRACRVMKKFGLRPARRAKTPLKPNDQGRESLDYPCVLSKLSPIAPDRVWASDFTFISYRGAFVSRCTVVDVFTGEVLGAALMMRALCGSPSSALSVAQERCPSGFTLIRAASIRLSLFFRSFSLGAP